MVLANYVTINGLAGRGRRVIVGVNPVASGAGPNAYLYDTASGLFSCDADASGQAVLS